MLEENGVFTLNLSCEHKELKNIHNEILNNINKIRKIMIIEDDILSSSALISLLVTIKSNYPTINIPLIDDNLFIKGVGNLTIIDKNNLVN